MEFLYIVRFYKQKWGIADVIPIHKSIEEYSGSLEQTGLIDVFSFSTEIPNGNGNDDNKNDNNDDDDDNGNNGAGGSGGGGMKTKINKDRLNNMKTKMMIHTCSSSLSHLIELFREQIRYRKQRETDLEWNRLLTADRYRYRTMHCRSDINKMWNKIVDPFASNILFH